MVLLGPALVTGWAESRGAPGPEAGSTAGVGATVSMRTDKESFHESI